MELETKNNSRLLSICKVLVFAYALTGILLLVLAFLLYKFEMARSKMEIAVVIIYILVNMIAGMIAGKAAREKKYIWGAIVGLCYFAILSIVSFIVTRSFYDSGSSAVVAFLVCTGSGMFGGMIIK